mgnify:CR=1 FL=1
MQLTTFFIIIDILIVLWTTLILFFLSKRSKKQILHFFKIIAYVLASMIIWYLVTIYAMFWWILARDNLLLSITFILITNILLYGIYTLKIDKKGKWILPIMINIIYMSWIIYSVYYFWFL